ncbi:MAG: tetratricopeptide repeat protein [Paracoccaceae bacterium]
MTIKRAFLKCSVAAAFALWAVGAAAQSADVDGLLAELARPEQERWARIERQILREWGRSGSAALDYIFSRGQNALQSGDALSAIGHFTAVIDQDPDFAEAWNGRATAFFLLNRLGQSMADIEQVLIRNPRHFGALAGMGMIFEQVERPERALEAYRASLAIHPHQQTVRESVARLELALSGRSL